MSLRDDLWHMLVSQVVLHLREEHFLGPLDQGGYAWDAYVLPLDAVEKAFSIALRVELGDDGKQHVVVGAFVPRRLTLDEVKTEMEAP